MNRLRRVRHALAIAAAAVLPPTFSGCADDGTVHRALAMHAPDRDALAQTIGQARSPDVPGTTWPSARWVAAFDDPQLNALVDEACANNPDLDVARARIAAAQAQLDAFGSTTGIAGTATATVAGAHLPRIDSAANISVAGTTLPIDLFTDPWVSPASVIGAARYDLDLWGKNRALTRSLVSERNAALVDAQQARLTLVTTLVTLYSQLDYQYSTRDLLQQKERDDDGSDAIVQARSGRGLDNGYEAEEAKVRHAALQSQLQQIDDAITETRLQIGVLTGHGPERGFALSRPRIVDPNRVALPSNLPLELLGRRPDIVAARLRASAATANVAAARAQFYPNIDLFATAGLSSLNVGSLLSGSSVLFAVGPALSLPVFERPRLRAQLHGAQANVDEMVSVYNKTLDEALGEVAKAIAALHSSDALIAQQEQIVAARGGMARIADERHRRGLLALAQVLAARSDLIDDELRLTSLRAQRSDAYIVLVRALGGGFDVKELDTHA